MLVMAKKRNKPDSKRSQGEDRHTKPRLAFHLDQALLDALDRYISVTKPQPTTTATLVAALEDFLKSRGHWPPKAAKVEE